MKFIELTQEVNDRKIMVNMDQIIAIAKSFMTPHSYTHLITGFCDGRSVTINVIESIDEIFAKIKESEEINAKLLSDKEMEK